MKKILLVVLFLYKINNIYSQSLLKNPDLEPEGTLGNKIAERLRTKLNDRIARGCNSYIFYVKFDLNEKSEIQNIKISANMLDSSIIGIVQNVIRETESMWDIEKCKRYNPTLKFLIPINMDIYSWDCNMQHTNKEVVKARYDFSSLLKYNPKAEGELNNMFFAPKEKFVGMVLSPLIINNGDPSH